MHICLRNLLAATLLALLLTGCRADTGGEAPPATLLTSRDEPGMDMVRVAADNRRLLIGDSMAYYCTWSGVDTVGLPTRTIKQVAEGLEQALDSGHVKRSYDEVYVFVGTADAFFPVGWSIETFAQRAESTSQVEISTLVNSKEKLEQFKADFASFVRFVKENIAYKSFVIISPFPNPDTVNFQLIEEADQALSAQFGAEYVDVNDAFYDFTRGACKDPVRFRDRCHLSESGYALLRQQMDLSSPGPKR